ncbi:LPS-assembly protein LptD [Crenothrix polyspora]|uniref:LPS-assembly protein LptD n=1 Tax=Crenothrix polyspora TaxID=360316 RepID=A0A1R4HD77_9GAMM|nr:LPS assembly protein LptD [Crenothrix polyspora]SJM94183.1 LPS-assembly protein LptD [Crenothrix polyspora]
MVRRLFWVCLPTLLSQASLASDDAWNCQQDKNSKEWVCMGDKNPTPPVDAAKQLGNKPLVKNRASVAAPAMQPIPEKPGALAPASKVEPVKLRVAPVVKTAPVSLQPPATEPTTSTPTTVTKALDAMSAAKEPVEIPDTTVEDIPVVAEKASATDVTPAQSSTDPGWHCGAVDAKENWDCKLVGADPKGKPKTVKSSDDDFDWRLLAPVFDRQEESIFSNLNDRFPVDPWATCSVEASARKNKPADKKLREESPLDMNSNYSEVFDNEVGNYVGNVDISRADQRASSQAAHYDTVSEILDLHGNVFYSEDEIGMYTNSATLKLASDEARLRDSLFISPTTPIRGRAKAIYRDNKFLSRYRDATYTSCKPGNQDWAVHASELKLNKETGKGAAKNAWLEFKGFPVFYSPYLSFPMDDRRMTGFLAPVFHNTRSNGFDISTPFYWNIAPNYDATLRPRYLMERGILLGGDFRYLTESAHGEFSAEFLPNDAKLSGNTKVGDTAVSENPNYDKSRYQFSLNNAIRFSPKITSNVDLNYVSDSNYFSDLGNSLSFSNFRYIKSNADLKYIDDGIRLTTQVVSYQKVDPTLTGRRVPYRMLPQINLGLDHTFNLMNTPVFAELDSEFVYFQHDTDTELKKVTNPVTGRQNLQSVTTVVPEGQRLNIKPSVSLPWKSESAYITPKASLQYTQYLLNNQGDAHPDTVSRVLPILSVDSGLYFEKNVDIASTTLQHTLEPRLFYLYIPRTGQKDMPVFDSGLYDFRYNSMFRENRFSGTDRVQDANQFTLALTSRLIDPRNGKERLKLNVGSILYLQDRDVTLASWNSDETTSDGDTYEANPEKSAFRQQRFSNFVAEASSQLSDHFSMDAGLQWNPRTNYMERGNIGMHFVNNPGELINLSFQYRRDDSKCRTSDAVIEKNVGVAYKPATPGCENLPHATPTAAELKDPDSPNNPYNDNTTQDIILSDASFRWPIYDDWYGIGRWQYSWAYGRTQEAFLGLEKENCCWRFRIIGRHYFNGLTNPNSSVTTSVANSLASGAEAQTGVFFQIELKGLTGIGQKLDDFFERNIYGYQKPQ